MRAVKAVREARATTEQEELRRAVAAQRKQAAEAKVMAEKQKAAVQAANNKAAAKRRAEKASASGDRPSKSALPAVVKSTAQRVRDQENAYRVMYCGDGCDVLQLEFSPGFLEKHHPEVADKLAHVKAEREVQKAERAAKKAASVAAAASNATSSTEAALQAKVAPTREFIAEVLEAHNELRACHGVHTPIQWSDECFQKAWAELKDYNPSRPLNASFDTSMSGVARGLLGCTGPMLYGTVPKYRLKGDGGRWWSAKHAVRYVYSCGADGWENMLRCSHVGAVISDSSCAFHLFYMGPFACKPIRAGDNTLSRRAIVMLERSLKAKGERFAVFGCQAGPMEAAWKELTKQVRISDRKEVMGADPGTEGLQGRNRSVRAVCVA